MLAQEIITPCGERHIDAFGHLRLSKLCRASTALRGFSARQAWRVGAWVEPVLVGEWTRLMRGYGMRLPTPVSASQAGQALCWLDPRRDTSIARGVTARLLAEGDPLICVWSGVSLRRAAAIDIDHCLPWSAWPCGDLWNLLPASRAVNQHQKKDRLPSMAALMAARDPIIAWWQRAWLDDPALRERFDSESAAALPVVPGANPDSVFDGLAWRRLRLRQDQQVAEWTPGGVARP